MFYCVLLFYFWAATDQIDKLRAIVPNPLTFAQPTNSEQGTVNNS